MRFKLYLATCPKCGIAFETLSAEPPRVCTCSLMSVAGCDGTLTWTKAPEPVPPGTVMTDDEIMNEIRAAAATREEQERDVYAEIQQSTSEMSAPTSALYMAMCPKCERVHQTRSRNHPPGCYCSTMSGSYGCDGVLAWVEAPEAIDHGPKTRPPTPEQEAAIRANNPHDRYSDPIKDFAALVDNLLAMPSSPPRKKIVIEKFDDAIAARDYFAAESKRNVEAARSLHAKNEKLRAQVADLIKEVDAASGMAGAHVGRNQELDRLNGDLHDQIREKDRTIFDLKAKIETRDQRNRDLDKLNGDNQQEIRDNHREISRLNGEIAQRDREIAKLKADPKSYDDRDDEIARLKRDREMRDAEIIRLLAEMKRTNDELAARHGTPTIYDYAMNSRDDELAKLKGDLKEANERAEHNLGTAKAHRLKLEVYEREIQQLNEHITRQDRLLDSAASMLASAATTAEAAQDEAGAFHEKLESAEEALTEARMQRDFNARSIDKLNADIATLQKITRDTSDKSATIGRIKTELETLERKMAGVIPSTEHNRAVAAHMALKWVLDPDNHKPVSAL